MKLKQVSEGYFICPKCKMRALTTDLSPEELEKGKVELSWDGNKRIYYHYECLNCKALFIDKDLIKKQKNEKEKME